MKKTIWITHEQYKLYKETQQLPVEAFLNDPKNAGYRALAIDENLLNECKLKVSSILFG